MATMSIKLSTNVSNVTATMHRMADYFEAAPEDDPAKRAMSAFGEINTDRDLVFTSDYSDGAVTVTVSLSPALQRIADMVPV